MKGDQIVQLLKSINLSEVPDATKDGFPDSALILIATGALAQELERDGYLIDWGSLSLKTRRNKEGDLKLIFSALAMDMQADTRGHEDGWDID